ncbi:hypothetical protein EP331_10250 [bacterium]|nr:MAG: hypothetical protein EP331_10250 [bacterium]
MPIARRIFLLMWLITIFLPQHAHSQQTIIPNALSSVGTDFSVLEWISRYHELSIQTKDYININLDPMGYHVSYTEHPLFIVDNQVMSFQYADQAALFFPSIYSSDIDSVHIYEPGSLYKGYYLPAGGIQLFLKKDALFTVSERLNNPINDPGLLLNERSSDRTKRTNFNIERGKTVLQSQLNIALEHTRFRLLHSYQELNHFNYFTYGSLVNGSFNQRVKAHGSAQTTFPRQSQHSFLGTVSHTLKNFTEVGISAQFSYMPTYYFWQDWKGIDPPTTIQHVQASAYLHPGNGKNGIMASALYQKATSTPIISNFSFSDTSTTQYVQSSLGYAYQASSTLKGSIGIQHQLTTYQNHLGYSKHFQNLRLNAQIDYLQDFVLTSSLGKKELLFKVDAYLLNRKLHSFLLFSSQRNPSFFQHQLHIQQGFIQDSIAVHAQQLANTNQDNSFIRAGFKWFNNFSSTKIEFRQHLDYWLAMTQAQLQFALINRRNVPLTPIFHYQDYKHVWMLMNNIRIEQALGDFSLIGSFTYLHDFNPSQTSMRMNGIADIRSVLAVSYTSKKKFQTSLQYHYTAEKTFAERMASADVFIPPMYQLRPIHMISLNVSQVLLKGILHLEMNIRNLTSSTEVYHPDAVFYNMIMEFHMKVLL